MINNTLYNRLFKLSVFVQERISIPEDRKVCHVILKLIVYVGHRRTLQRKKGTKTFQF